MSGKRKISCYIFCSEFWRSKRLTHYFVHRFTQPPGELWDWFEPYMDDSEVRGVGKNQWSCFFHLILYYSVLVLIPCPCEQEVDVRAGGGQVITIGEMVRLFLTKLDWFSSLFPRIPVPIQVSGASITVLCLNRKNKLYSSGFITIYN